MALKFKLVMRKNLGEDHESIPEKVYAQMVYGDLVTFDEFAEEVADSSGVGSASVKAVLDRMNVVLVRHLQHGRRVSVGELGLFRFCFGSSGVPDEKTFSTNLILVLLHNRWRANENRSEPSIRPHLPARRTHISLVGGGLPR